MIHVFIMNENFNSDVSSWNVVSVTSMGGMFNNAQEINSDISYNRIYLVLIICLTY